MSHASTARHAMNVEHFDELVKFCAALEPTRYHPVRLNLKIKALQEALEAARSSVAATEKAHAELGRFHEAGAESVVDAQAQKMAQIAYDHAKDARTAALYAPGVGIVELANDCKIYLKSLKGPKEPELHHITHLEFKAPA
jgi:multidrug resistance efflux pump